MRNAGRVVLAVLAGAAVWAVLWIAGTQAAQLAFPEALDPTRPVAHTGFLFGYIGYSVVLSVLAGWVTAVVRGARPMTAVWILAVLQFALGIAAEVSYWDLLPLWYHLVFLGLIVPATVYGGVRRVRRRALGVAST